MQVVQDFDFVSPPDVIGTTAAFFNGRIDLDPASSELANGVVCANRFYEPKDDGLRQPWKADHIYLYPPRDCLRAADQPVDLALYRKRRTFRKSAQRVWLEEAMAKYRRQEFNEAIVFLTSTEVALSVTQRLEIDLPMCIMRDKPELYCDIPELPKLENPRCYGFIFYIPSPLNTEKRIGEFYRMFSELGRVYV